VDRVEYAEAVARIVAAARERRVCRVACANVHVVMEARDDRSLLSQLERFELVVADGQPIRWALAADAPALADRVYGPELMRRCVIAARDAGLGIFLYGSTPAVITRLSRNLPALAEGVRIVGAEAPPMGDALWADADAAIERMRTSGASMVFIGLGCPRQERWIARFGERVGVPCLAVGAAFDLLAGEKRMAPALMQRLGLEWLYRLGTEPQRTFRRYLLHNPRFMLLAGAEALARLKRRRS